MNYTEKTQMDMPDIDIIGDEGGEENEPWPQHRPPVRPIPPIPPINSRVVEGCVCIALLSLTSTVISLLMLKGKIM